MPAHRRRTANNNMMESLQSATVRSPAGWPAVHAAQVAVVQPLGLCLLALGAQPVLGVAVVGQGVAQGQLNVGQAAAQAPLAVYLHVSPRGVDGYAHVAVAKGELALRRGHALGHVLAQPLGHGRPNGGYLAPQRHPRCVVVWIHGCTSVIPSPQR